MNQFSFCKILPIEPISLPKTELIKLADSIRDNTSKNEYVLSEKLETYEAILPRSIDEIINDITYDKFENISLLEWIYCIHKKKDWDFSQPYNRQLNTARQIWKAAHSNKFIKVKLFWELALYFDQKQQEYNCSFASTFDEFIDAFSPHGMSISRLQILKQENSEKAIAQLSYKNKITPKQIFKNASLPISLSSIIASYQHIVQEFTEEEYPTTACSDWLRSCLNEMDFETQLLSVENILEALDPEIGKQNSNLLAWMRSNYGLDSNSSKSSHLSSNARKALRKWIGAANYRDFEKLSSIILEHIQLENWEKNQLNMRKYFWSHYSDRFEKIRILVPQSTINEIGNLLDSEFNNIDILKNDGSEETEVCIFDFGNWIVIEFFRGDGSETRLINRQFLPEAESLLFETKEVSIKLIRRLKSKIHDHKYLWQVFCERWLHECNIDPNEGTTIFIRPGRGKDVEEKYDLLKGIFYRPRELEKRIEAEWKIQQWKQKIIRLEKEAEDWSGTMINSDQNSRAIEPV